MSSKNGTITAPEATTEEASFKLTRLQRETFVIPIRGTSPLIVNRWSEKAKEMMLQAQQTKARTKKDPKDPVANFQASRYLLDDGRDGFPSTGFKASIVHATRLFDGITQVLVKQTVLVTGEGSQQLVVLDYGNIKMREDTVRNASGVADLRYRAEYWPWSAELHVRTIGGQFDRDSIMSLVDAAGIGGVGEWRPTSPKSATGTYGTFEVVES